jgi:hypothetical protein
MRCGRDLSFVGVIPLPPLHDEVCPGIELLDEASGAGNDISVERRKELAL